MCKPIFELVKNSEGLRLEPLIVKIGKKRNKNYDKNINFVDRNDRFKGIKRG